MEAIDLEQGSLEWFEYRFQHRNASEAGTVMGANPWQTPRQLYEEKLHRRIGKENAAMQHGNNLEAAARAKASKVLGVELHPAVFKDGDYSASLDGYGLNTDTWKVEIKCPYTGVDGSLWRQMQSETNRIPEHYYWQLVHQSMVCPTTHTVFFVYIDDDTWDMCHYHHSQEDEAKLKAAWDEFYENPPEEEYKPVEDEEVIAAISTHKMLKEQEKALKANLAEIEKFLKSAVTQNSVHDHSFVQWVERKGNVDYAKVPELTGVDLDQYRKKSTTYMKITHKEAK